MSRGTFAKVAASKATDICSLYELEGEARQLLRDDLSPAAYVERLIDHGRYADGIRFLAHALPKREAVAWACYCIRRACGDDLAEPCNAALTAAEQWISEPSEANRRAAQAAGEKAGFDTPAGCAAAAVFFSGGSLAPPHVPEVAPGPTLTAQGVAGSLLLAAVQKEPEKLADKQRDFVLRGVEFANGA